MLQESIFTLVKKEHSHYLAENKLACINRLEVRTVELDVWCDIVTTSPIWNLEVRWTVMTSTGTKHAQKQNSCKF